MGLVGDTVHLITVPLYEIQGRLGSQVGFCLWGNDLGEYVSWSFLFFCVFLEQTKQPRLTRAAWELNGMLLRAYLRDGKAGEAGRQPGTVAGGQQEPRNGAVLEML